MALLKLCHFESLKTLLGAGDQLLFHLEMQAQINSLVTAFYHSIRKVPKTKSFCTAGPFCGRPVLSLPVLHVGRLGLQSLS